MLVAKGAISRNAGAIRLPVYIAPFRPRAAAPPRVRVLPLRSCALDEEPAVGPAVRSLTV